MNIFLFIAYIKSHMKHFFWAAFFLTGVVNGFSTSYTLDATSFGAYKSTGRHVTGNYLAGNAGSNEYFRDYFVFDLSSIPIGETITSATLLLLNSTNGYNSADPSETYTNFPLDSTTVPVLMNGNGSNALNVPIYDDLGNGIAFSSGVAVSAASIGMVVQVALNNSFLTYAQTNVGNSVAFGGAITTLDSNDNTFERIFGTQGVTPSAKLAIGTVPEPTTTVLLMFSALITIIVRSRRGLSKAMQRTGSDCHG